MSSCPLSPFDPEKLVQLAFACLERAYAPYSNFQVAAVVVDEQGRLFSGVNVENASYGLTMCAERVAIFSAVSAGAKRISAVAVVAKKGGKVAPCGACRQVFAEFCDPSVLVFTDGGEGLPHCWTVGELLPSAFTPLDLTVKT